MHAILEIGNKQYKVSEKNMIEVDRIEGKEQDTITLDKIVLANIDDKTTIGTPIIKNSSAKARIIRHFKDEKVIVFRKNRRHNFRRKNGHRQHMTLLEVEEISIDGKVVKLSGKGESSIGKFTLDKMRQKQIADAKPLTRAEKVAKSIKQAEAEKQADIEPLEQELNLAQKADEGVKE